MTFDMSLYKNLKRKVDLYLSIKQYESIREFLENKLEAHPGDLRLSKLLVLIHFFENKTDKALALLDNLQKLYPEEKELKLLFIALQCELGAYDKASGSYEVLTKELSSLVGQTLSAERLAEEFISCGSTLYKSENYSRAIVQFSQAVTLCPESSEAVVCLAKSQMKLGEDEKAEHLLKGFCKNQNPSSEVHLWLGLIYFKLSRFSLASFHFEKAKQLNPESRLPELYLKALPLDKRSTAFSEV